MNKIYETLFTESSVIDYLLSLMWLYQARDFVKLKTKTTYEEWYQVVLRCGPNLTGTVDRAFSCYIKQRLHRESLNRWYAIQQFCSDTDINYEANAILDNLLNTNRIDIAVFKRSVMEVLTCAHMKINTLRLVGVANSGKSMICQAIASALISYTATLTGVAGEFYFSDMIDKSLLCLEELWILPQTADDFKTILSGYPIYINRKGINGR